MRNFNLILGIIEVCFLPGLLIVMYIYKFQIGLIHGAIGGVFFYMGILNIKKAFPKQDASDKTE